MSILPKKAYAFSLERDSGIKTVKFKHLKSACAPIYLFAESVFRFPSRSNLSKNCPPYLP